MGPAGYALQFYSQASSLAPAMDAAKDPAIVNSFLACMPSSAELFKIFVRGKPDLDTSLLPKRGDEDDEPIEKKGTATTNGRRLAVGAALHPDNKSEAVQMIFRGTAPTRRLGWLHFLPDEWLVGQVTDGTRSIDPQLKTQLELNLFPQIVSRFSIRYRIREDQAGYGYQNVQYLTSDAGGNSTIVKTTANHGFSSGQYVTFSGYNHHYFTRNLRGKFRVTVIDDTSFSIPCTYQNCPQPHTVGTVTTNYNDVTDLRVRRLAYSLDNITRGQVGLQRAKRVGRSFRSEKANNKSDILRKLPPIVCATS